MAHNSPTANTRVCGDQRQEKTSSGRAVNQRPIAQRALFGAGQFLCSDAIAGQTQRARALVKERIENDYRALAHTPVLQNANFCPVKASVTRLKQNSGIGHHNLAQWMPVIFYSSNLFLVCTAIRLTSRK